MDYAHNCLNLCVESPCLSRVGSSIGRSASSHPLVCTVVHKSPSFFAAHPPSCGLARAEKRQTNKKLRFCSSVDKIGDENILVHTFKAEITSGTEKCDTCKIFSGHF